MFVNFTQVFTFFGLLFLTVVVGIMIAYDRRIKWIKNYNVDMYTDKLRDHAIILGLIQKGASIDCVERFNILKSNSAAADPKFGDEYTVSVIESAGNNAKQVKDSFQLFKIDKEYAKLIVELSNKKRMLIGLDNMPSEVIKRYAIETGAKEYGFYHVTTFRNQFFYIVVSCIELGGIKKNEAEIERIIAEIRKIYNKS